MIRYVNIGDQINAGAEEFAFFDTTTGSFITFDGSQTFETVAEFVEYAEGHPLYERCLNVMPYRSTQGGDKIKVVDT